MTGEGWFEPYAQLATQLEHAFQKKDQPAFEKANVNHWVLACEFLVWQGRLDVLEFSVRQLHAAYPSLRYAASMTGVFDNIPAGPLPLLNFSDNFEADLQIVERPGSDKVLIAFCGHMQRLGLPLGLMHLWLGRLPVSLIYLRDFQKSAGGLGYPSLGPDRATTMKSLRELISRLGAKEIFTFGNSSGVFAALHYGLNLGATATLCTGGVTNLAIESITGTRVESKMSRLLKNAPEYAVDLRELYAHAEKCPRAIIVYGKECKKDRQQAENMAGFPMVELLPIEDCIEHNVIVHLLSRGIFPALLNRFLGI